MKHIVILLSLLLLSPLAALAGNGVGAHGNAAAVLSLPLEPLSDAEIDSLLLMREEEKLAQDVYLTLDEKWSLRVFDNIAASEAQHTGRVALLLDRYDLTDPVIEERGLFSSEALQALYGQLVASGSVSVIDALLVGATIEDLDIHDLQQALLVVDNQDVRLVYQNLMKGSRNHLRAFCRNLAALGVTYQAQYLTQAEVDAILASPMESGAVDANGSRTSLRGRPGQANANGNGNGGGH